jgi:hypothetical protein
VSNYKYPVVCVEWLDHHRSDDWVSAENIQHEPALCKTIGWEFKNDDVGITIVGSIDESGNYGNIMFIMKSCVRKYSIVRKASAPRVRKVKEKVQKDAEYDGRQPGLPNKV